MKLLLDTCTLIWLVEGADDLSPRASELISSSSNELVVSVASIWEMANKSSAGRLPMTRPLHEWVEDVFEEYAITPLPVDLESAVRLARLPMLHGDPFDRMLVSQAIVHGLVLLTPDKAIARYPARTMW